MPRRKSARARKRSSGSSWARWRKPRSLSNCEKCFRRLAACGEQRSTHPTTPAMLEWRWASWRRKRVSSSDWSAWTAMVASMLPDLRASSRSSGMKSHLRRDISSVIQEWRTALYCQKCWCASILIFHRDTNSPGSSVEIEKPAVDRIIRTGDESRFVGTQKQGQRRHFFRIGHAADGLRFGKFLKHFLFTAGIILFQVTVHEGGVDARGRNTIAANLMRQIVACNGEGHGEDRSFAHGIGKTIGEAGSSGDGGHIDNDSAAVGLHRADGRVHAVVNAFHVYEKNAVKVGFRGGLELADVGNAGAVHENIGGLRRWKPLKQFRYAALISNVTDVRSGACSGSRDFLSSRVGIFFVEVHDADHGPFLRKSSRDGASNPAGRASYDSDFAVKAKPVGMFPGVGQSETPLFQGMKSSCESISALVRASPLATWTTRSRMVSPICSMVVSPEMMPPQSMSMISGMRRARFELVEIFKTGTMGLPVGVPSPVVNKTTFAPAPTWAVTHSTSLPGVHCRLRPGSLEYSG